MLSCSELLYCPCIGLENVTKSISYKGGSKLQITEGLFSTIEKAKPGRKSKLSMYPDFDTKQWFRKNPYLTDAALKHISSKYKLNKTVLNRWFRNSRHSLSSNFALLLKGNWHST